MIARKTQKIIYNIVIICLLIGGVTYVCSRFIHLGNIEYTDNAQVKQHITPINTRVPGFIKKIYFDEYQQVRKGDTLLIIEDAEFVSVWHRQKQIWRMPPQDARPLPSVSPLRKTI